MGLFFLHNTRELTHQYFPNVFFISALQKSAQFQKGIAGHLDMKIWQKKFQMLFEPNIVGYKNF